MSAISLGAFQFSNLLAMRVPFILCHDNLDFAKKYSGQELQHIQRYSQKFVEASQLVEIMKAQGYPLFSPVIWVCRDGVVSKRYSHEGEAVGLTNCHFIEGGFDLLLRAVETD